MPDWNLGSGLFVYAMPGVEGKMTDEYAQLSTALDVTHRDEVAKRYASEIGTRYRYEFFPTALARVSEEGTFQFSHCRSANTS